MSKYDTIIEVRKFNPYHGADGRFSTESGAASFTFRPGKSKAHDTSVRRAQLKLAANKNALDKIERDLDQVNSAIAYHEMTKPKNDEDVPLF